MLFIQHKELTLVCKFKLGVTNPPPKHTHKCAHTVLLPPPARILFLKSFYSLYICHEFW